MLGERGKWRRQKNSVSFGAVPQLLVNKTSFDQELCKSK